MAKRDGARQFLLVGRNCQSTIRTEEYFARPASPGAREIVKDPIGTKVVIEGPRFAPEVRESVTRSNP